MEFCTHALIVSRFDCVVKESMLFPSPLTLLIDGNNLAHVLYANLSGRKMTTADSLQLMDHLKSYALTYPNQLQIELILDHALSELPPLPDNLRIFFAEYPQTADDLLLHRFWFYRFNREPALVISNDEAILAEVSEAHGAWQRGFDFVRRRGQRPVFRAPEELPCLHSDQLVGEKSEKPASLHSSIYFRIFEDRQTPLQAAKNRSASTLEEKPDQKAPVLEPSRPPAPALEAPVSGENVNDPAPGDLPTETEGPYYLLDLDNWPVNEGVRFLLNAFCPRHRQKYHELMSAFDPNQLRPADLRALTELLLFACGSEPDFARRGSLMTRVRLALLQAQGEVLSLQQIAKLTDLKLTGLQGRIKQKAVPWVATFYA